MTRQRQITVRRRLGVALLGSWLCVAVAVGSTHAGANESVDRPQIDRSRTERLRPDASSRSTPSTRSLLSVRAGFELETLSALDRFRVHGGAPSESIFDREMSDRVASMARRAARDRLRDELLELPSVANLLERRLGGGGDDGPAVTAADRAWRVKVSVRRAIPGAELRRPLTRGELKLSVDLSGRIGLRFRSEGMRRAELSAGYDGDDAANLSCVVRF